MNTRGPWFTSHTLERGPSQDSDGIPLQVSPFTPCFLRQHLMYPSAAVLHTANGKLGHFSYHPAHFSLILWLLWEQQFYDPSL